MKITIISRDVDSLKQLKLRLLGADVVLTDIPHNGHITIDSTNGDIDVTFESSIIEDLQAVEDLSSDDLFQKLSALRRQISSEERLPPYCICHDKTLLEICKVLPCDLEQLSNISGMGNKKVSKYGSRFIEVIRNHVA